MSVHSSKRRVGRFEEFLWLTITASLISRGDAAAVNRGYVYVINGFDLRIPYGATQFVTLRSVLNKRGPVRVDTSPFDLES